MVSILVYNKFVMSKNKTEKSGNSCVKKILSNIYMRNIIYAVLIFTALIFASKWFLSCYTRHSESFPVPDFKGIHIDDAKNLAAENSIRIEISDSLFTVSSPAGTVLEQNPKANVHVKKDRMIYVTVNCISPKKVEVPNVV